MKVAHLIRKPISEGSVGRNVLEHGTGGINIDATRIRTAPRSTHSGGVNRQKRHAHPMDNIRVTTGSGGESGGSEDEHVVSAASGRWPSNLVLIHKPECRLAGTRPAEGYTINRWSDGAKPFGGGAGHPYESSEVEGGLEEVWECVEGCPVKELDGQSGDSGGASRFFKQIRPAADFVRMSGRQTCETCGKLYYDHPYDYGFIAYDGKPYIRVLCDGTRMKL